MFEEPYRVEGGRFFDPETMRAQINNEIGVKAFEGIRSDNAFIPPSVETWGFVEALSSFLAGDIAMTISWPPFGRRAEADTGLLDLSILQIGRRYASSWAGEDAKAILDDMAAQWDAR